VFDYAVHVNGTAELPDPGLKQGCIVNRAILKNRLLALLNFERPTLNGHVPLDQKVFEVFLVNAVMSTGKPESLEPIALDPFQYRALANLAVSGDILRC
jgi:hypothetical protein